jgi:hypothetical protein
MKKSYGFFGVQSCNPIYSGDKDQEDHGSKPALHKNRAGGVAQGKGPKFKPQYHTQKKKKSKGQKAY